MYMCNYSQVAATMGMDYIAFMFANRLPLL